MQRKSLNSVRVFYPKFNRKEIVQKIREGLINLEQKIPLQKVVLFGSYAKGNYTVASDIDLLIVYKGREREDVYALSKGILAIPGLQPHIYFEAEYEQLKPTIERMIRDGIVIL